MADAVLAFGIIFLLGWLVVIGYLLILTKKLMNDRFSVMTYVFFPLKMCVAIAVCCDSILEGIIQGVWWLTNIASSDLTVMSNVLSGGLFKPLVFLGQIFLLHATLSDLIRSNLRKSNSKSSNKDGGAEQFSSDDDRPPAAISGDAAEPGSPGLDAGGNIGGSRSKRPLRSPMLEITRTSRPPAPGTLVDNSSSLGPDQIGISFDGAVSQQSGGSSNGPTATNTNRRSASGGGSTPRGETPHSPLPTPRQDRDSMDSASGGAAAVNMMVSVPKLPPLRGPLPTRTSGGGSRDETPRSGRSVGGASAAVVFNERGEIEYQARPGSGSLQATPRGGPFDDAPGGATSGSKGGRLGGHISGLPPASMTPQESSSLAPTAPRSGGRVGTPQLGGPPQYPPTASSTTTNPIDHLFGVGLGDNLDGGGGLSPAGLGGGGGILGDHPALDVNHGGIVDHHGHSSSLDSLGVAAATVGPGQEPRLGLGLGNLGSEGRMFSSGGGSSPTFFGSGVNNPSQQHPNSNPVNSLGQRDDSDFEFGGTGVAPVVSVDPTSFWYVPARRYLLLKATRRWVLAVLFWFLLHVIFAIVEKGERTGEESSDCAMRERNFGVSSCITQINSERTRWIAPRVFDILRFLFFLIVLIGLARVGVKHSKKLLHKPARHSFYKTFSILLINVLLLLVFTFAECFDSGRTGAATAIISGFMNLATIAAYLCIVRRIVGLSGSSTVY